MAKIDNPWIKLLTRINQEDYEAIQLLEQACCQADGTALKLELDYKLAAGETESEASGSSSVRQINDFLYYDGSKLIGYMGINDFGGAGMPIEVNGMVHPGYRRQGIFKQLSGLLMDEWARRTPSDMLLLTDRSSVPGQSFVKGTGAVYKHTEYEMYLRTDHQTVQPEGVHLSLRKAVNADAPEISRQNMIYFHDELGGDPAAEAEVDLLLPEEEEKKGMTIYLAEVDGQVVGKVHIQLTPAAGGIYGLGILPEYRGLGYGRATLQMAIAKLQEAKANAIMLQVAADNAGALQLYKSCGFVETSTMDYYKLTRQVSCRNAFGML
ncbi:GNAT family N-acetyltransferase [Paenibacillus sambharensis]|uniref:GNAT family N-acetyltransferase n=1 Tax=Paenibacillus sambharensis TaxID=1803190 RepID=A0A2W1L1Y1_9BACL|nr:GNAT family N-acetyltransferase [Paenibacillus sambharensis]PZD93063.1 GNAT family N-acetyltransferase [Paenibacillus sambharensis]